MKKTTRTARKVLSVFLSVLMILTTLTVAVPGIALAADTYYVRVYLNIYDGANSDGYGNAYTVVTDPTSEFYGKPDDYKWDYGSSWSATDNSAGYDGEINMAGFTLFYNNDSEYVTYDLNDDLVEATTTLGNNFTSMDDLTLENFDQCTNMVQKVYPFELTSFPTSLFWINDENNAVNGETGFAIHKITVAESSTGTEHTLWTGLSGSESYYECYYGTITPTGLITPWDDCPDATTYTFYKDYTTSAVGTWIDPYNAGDYNVYPVNNYISGGVSASFTVGNSGSSTDIDYVDVGNTNNYYINFTNHSTQDATITGLNNSSLINGYSNGLTLASGETKSFLLNKSSMGTDDGGYYNLAFSYTLDNVYNSDGTTLTSFYQANGIGTWNSTDDSKAIGMPSGESSNNGFTIYRSGTYNLDISNQFMTDIGIIEEVSTSGNRTTAVNFEYKYWLDTSGLSNWSETGLRMYSTRYTNYRHVLQETTSDGTISIGDDYDIINNDASIGMAGLVGSYTGASDTISEPPTGYATKTTFYRPYWAETNANRDKGGYLYDLSSAYFRFSGNIFKYKADAENAARINFYNMTWRNYADNAGAFSGNINVYSFDKTDLRNYVRNLGGLGANWAPMKNRFNADKWSAYEGALETAMKVLANQKTNQKAVTDAYNALYSATEALKASANLVNQVAYVTYTKRAGDYDAAASATWRKYLIMPIGTETTVPSYDSLKWTVASPRVAKQSSNLKTNYTISDTGINPIDYRYWFIDFTGVDDALTKASEILNTPLETYSDAYYEDVQDARTALSAFDRDADTWTPTHQSDIDDALANLNDLLAHDSTDPAVHQFIVKDNKSALFYDDANHWYECEICGYQYAKTAHTLEYTPIENNTAEHTVTCTHVDGEGSTCDYTATANHDWNDGEVTDAPSCGEAGVMTYTCNDCGATKTEAIEAEKHNFVITDLGDGTHISKCSKCGANEDDAVAEAHTLSYVNNNDGTHTATCSVCGATETVAHTFTNPVLARPTLVDGTWKNGTYTYTCVCGETKVETAERADYTELDKAVEELEELNNNENLTDDAKAEIAEALEKAEALADDLVTAEQDQIDDLVKELQDVKTDVENAISEVVGSESVTESDSGIKVQFLAATGVDKVDYVQLDADGTFESVRMRLINGNKDLPITVTSVTADKAAIGFVDAFTLDKNGGSKDLVISDTDDFNEAGIITYTIKYTIDGLKNADGSAVEFTTKAYLYVKKAAYNPYHFMDEKTGLGGVSKWDHFVEATNYGDFTLISENTASKFSDKLESGTKWYSFGTAHTTYDYDEDGCQAGCTTSEYASGDGHAATYGYFVDTSLAPTWEAAGFRLRIAETKESTYQNAPLKTIRVANDQAFLDGIKGDDKTFTLTFYPSATGTQNKTWAITSTGTLDVATYANPDEDNELLFGEHKNKDGFTENTVLALMTGEIPSGVNEAKFMLSPRIEFNGTLRSESVTMTSHIWLTTYDKAALREAVANAEQAGYNSEYFDAEKYEAYEKALENAKVVLGKAETNQTEVDEATAALNNAIADLTASESEAKFVLTVIHSIHENADKNSEATGTEYDYYLVNGDVTPALKASVIALDTINKYDDVATLNVTADAEHTYNYWYIDYSKVQDAIDAADGIINDTTTGYSDEYKAKVEAAKDALQNILNGKDATTTPESQDDVDNAIDAVTALTGHTCDEEVEIPAVSATCEGTGLTEGAKCSVCGKITKVQTVTGPNGHDYDKNNDGEVTRADAVYTAPVKDAEGNWSDAVYTYTCESGCGASYTETVSRADYDAYDKAVADLNKVLAENTNLTEDAKNKISKALEDNDIADNLDADSQKTVTDAADALNKVLTEVNNGIADGSMVYVDLSAYNAALEIYNNTTVKVAKAEDKTAAQTAIDSVAGITSTSTKANGNQDKIDAAEKVLAELNSKYAKCAINEHDYEITTTAPTCTSQGYTTYTCKVCGNSYDDNFVTSNGHDWSAWVLTTAPTKDAEGTYTRTCSKGDATETKAVARENYTAYDSAIERAENMLDDEKLTDAAKDEIREAITEAEKLDKKLPADVVEDGETIIDNNSDETIKAATDALTEVLDKITNDTTGAYEKVDYTNYNEAVNAYEALKDTMTAEDRAAVEAIKTEITKIPADGTKKDYQAQVDKAAEDIAAINAKYGDCANGNHTDVTTDNDHNCDICGKEDVTVHNYVNPVLTRPTQNGDGTWNDGYYTSTCNCGDTSTTEAKRANYTAYDEAVAGLNALLADENLTDAAKAEINKVLADNAILQDYIATTDEQKIVDDAAAALKVVLDKINNDTTGAYEKVDYTNYNAAVNAYEALKDTMTAEDKAAVEAIKTEIAKIPADGSKADYQAQVDKAAADIAAINAKYGDCANDKHNWSDPVLTTKPTADAQGEYTETCGTCGATQTTKVDLADYSEFNTVVGQLENLAKTENLTDEAKKAIEDALDKADALDKNLPADATTADGKVIKGGQDEINTLVNELKDIVADTNAAISNGSALKPDYDAWEEAEGKYDALDKTNVKADIIARADELKDTIADKQANTNHTQATATQTQINDATAELNAIVEGIENGTHIKPADYTEVNKDLAEAKDKAESELVSDETRKEIAEIEDKLNEYKNDPTTNANDQDEINALEKELEEIIKEMDAILNGAPDFSGYDASHDEYEALVEQYGDKIKDSVADDVAALDTIVDGVRNDDTATKADDQDTIDDAKTALDEIIAGIKDGSLKDPDYKAVEDKLDIVNGTDNLTKETQDKIDEIEKALEEIKGKKDPEANAKDDQYLVDILEKQLDEILDAIEDGSALVPDYTKWEEAETAYDTLDKTNIQDEIIAEANKLKEDIDKLQKTEGLTQATATQKDIDDATARLNEIIAGINDGSLKKPADYAEVDKDLADAKDKADKNDVTDGVKDDIKAIEDKLNEYKNDPTTNADDQDEIDALEKELEDIIAGITDGTLVKPDYTEWEKAETAYDKLDTTNVKAEIITEADALKAEIAAKQADKTLTKATATQDDIDAATKRLNEIVAGITDGSLKNPADFTEVDKDLADAKDKAENNDVIDSVKEEIKEIEDKLDELRDTATADDQDEIDAIEDRLEEIIAGIVDGSLVKPDYTGADEAIKNAEGDIDNGGKLTDEDKAALDALKDALDKIKNDSTSNKKDDQSTVDGIKDAVQVIVNKYAECAKGNHINKTTEVAPTCTADGYKLHTCKICGKTSKEAGEPAKGHAELTLNAKEPSCSEVGLTEGKQCAVCGEILVAQQEIAKLPHVDANDDGVCDNCNHSGLYDGCACLCHNNHWFWHIIYLIIRIIWKVFKIHPVCACGRIHY